MSSKGNKYSDTLSRKAAPDHRYTTSMQYGSQQRPAYSPAEEGDFSPYLHGSSSYDSHRTTSWARPPSFSHGHPTSYSSDPFPMDPASGLSIPGYPRQDDEACSVPENISLRASAYASTGLPRKSQDSVHGYLGKTSLNCAPGYLSSQVMGPSSSLYGQPMDLEARSGHEISSPVRGNLDYESQSRAVPAGALPGATYPTFLDHIDDIDRMLSEELKNKTGKSIKPHHTQKRANRDEFDGPTQLLQKPPLETIEAQNRVLPHVPINLDAREQNDVLSQVNIRLSQCAFDFVAKYQFPIPLEADKRPVQEASDRDWTEWVYLLKRLATKRRIPARVLYNGQIKQLVTVLENSLEMRHASVHQSRPPKDDRNVLQLISAGTQVAKMLRDANTMEYLDRLYKQTEITIQERRREYIPAAVR